MKTRLHRFMVLSCIGAALLLLSACATSTVTVSSRELKQQPLAGRTIYLAGVKPHSPECRVPPAEEQAMLTHLLDRLHRRSAELKVVTPSLGARDAADVLFTVHILKNEISQEVKHHSSTSSSTETCTDENGKTHTHDVSTTSYETWAVSFRSMTLMYQLTDAKTQTVLWQATGDFCPGTVNWNESGVRYPEAPRFNGPPEPSKVANAITTSVIRKLPVK